MKKLLSLAVMLVFGLTTALAQAEIKFDKVAQDLGTFSEESPVKKAVFTFTNVGNKPLVLNQVVASCGCTVPRYDKKPIAPGQKGTISVTYNGTGKFPGPLQEEHHRPLQRQDRAHPPLCRGRDDGEEIVGTNKV